MIWCILMFLRVLDVCKCCLKLKYLPITPFLKLRMLTNSNLKKKRKILLTNGMFRSGWKKSESGQPYSETSFIYTMIKVVNKVGFQWNYLQSCADMLQIKIFLTPYSADLSVFFFSFNFWSSLKFDSNILTKFLGKVFSVL